MLMEMIKFGIAGFKSAKSIEGTIDTALEQLTQKAAQAAQNPQPNPDAIKAQQLYTIEHAHWYREQLQAVADRVGAPRVPMPVLTLPLPLPPIVMPKGTP